jgi:methylmalonyl-CoA carboxyltransferase large subunit
MAKERITLARVAEVLDGLRQEVARLSDRVTALEKRAATGNTAAGMIAAASASPAGDGVSDEVIMVIAAAVAAFLGKKAHVRQIRLVGSAAWLHQGRITVQASHTVARVPG